MPVLAHPGDAVFQSVEARCLAAEGDQVGAPARLKEPYVIAVQKPGGVTAVADPTG